MGALGFFCARLIFFFLTRDTRTPQFKKINMDDFVRYQEKMKMDAQIKELKKRIRVSDDVILKDNLKSMKRVLRRLGMDSPFFFFFVCT